MLLTSCSASDPAVSDTPIASTAATCGENAYLETELYGAIRQTLRWRDNLVCEGMPRPAGQGARIRMSGPANGETAQQLALILGMPGLRKGITGEAVRTNVTLIAEDKGLFFGTTDAENCWTDVDKHEPSGDGVNYYRISGVLYCVAPLPEINGSKSITLGELEFSAALNWNEPG